ncbi:RING finger domain-containing protein [Arthroderma uncinatum]|uniref:RING finger domain-containing protein n=1 Tax=Arthroderma uncinatum TaxID=74035 RepID=UPI00144AA4AA|nr:RING finger domain-containing protein [Arthroderma uncinatum]KAF3491528.1 RING finger domain-containing protein [Arthroderma uncinatum]
MASPPSPPPAPDNPQESSSSFSDMEPQSRRDNDREGAHDAVPVDSHAEESDDTVLLNRRLSSELEADAEVGTQLDEVSNVELIDCNREPETDSQSNVRPVTEFSSPTEAEISRKEDELRKCWICYTDESEDSPLNTEWRSPCPCALSAHEACLLDWLADMENTDGYNLHKEGATMLCPQCKSEIHMSRPRNLILDLVRKFEGTVWAGCCAHGVYSMYFIFGREKALQLLAGATQGPWNPRLNLGLPLIPVSLILSRTRYSDGLLPAIPVIFFATHHPYNQDMDIQLWPPSAAMTFAALPYVKSFYNILYKKFFGKLERQWISTVRTRLNADDGNQEGDGQGQGTDDDQAEGEIVMEIELQVGLNGNEHQVIHAIEEEERRNDEQPGNQVLARRQADVLRETTNLADIILGALIFPAISAGMGGILKLALPKAWTNPPLPFERGRPWLLQTRWGRSVIGGCVFVLLKDALTLYCRYKRARLHSQRVILNYDRKTQQPVLPSA